MPWWAYICRFSERLIHVLLTTLGTSLACTRCTSYQTRSAPTPNDSLGLESMDPNPIHGFQSAGKGEKQGTSWIHDEMSHGAVALRSMLGSTLGGRLSKIVFRVSSRSRSWALLTAALTNSAIACPPSLPMWGLTSKEMIRPSPPSVARTMPEPASPTTFGFVVIEGRSKRKNDYSGSSVLVLRSHEILPR
jgi:hypothetical protein